MTSDFSLNWATLAVSIFNTILLLWLGLTVFLNSERRSLGIWVAGVGLLMGSSFFLSHTAILGLGPLQPEARLNSWWKTGWIPVVSMPFAWYLVMLWYSSYWDDLLSPIHLRHQVPLVFIGFSPDVLLHPGAPGRLMGHLARHRARPWLLVATLALLLVSLSVGMIIIWGIYIANQELNPSQFARTISIFDLVIDLLIAITILSVGQAVVSYEIFT